jgi:hypothetical protein
MPAYLTATVSEVLAERAGLQRVATDQGRAYVLTGLVGSVGVGDRVVLNTTAVELGLGTGGWHVVHWNLARESWSQPGPGHIMKMRYTSLQADTGAAEEAHPDLPADLGNVPVVACTLHSQVGVVAALVRHLRPDASVAYVMTDGAALPVALSDLAHTLREAKVLDGIVTAGHAFGGDLEAVSLPSALVLARHVLEADVIVVGMGPGVVGTGSALGTTSVEAAAILDTATALAGRAGLCVRASRADPRDRHLGVSHHVLTVLGLVRDRPAVPVPAELVSAVAGGHAVEVPDVGAVLDGMGLRITSMGRGPEDDPLFYAAAGAAGVWAASGIVRP